MWPRMASMEMRPCFTSTCVGGEGGVVIVVVGGGVMEIERERHRGIDIEGEIEVES
jgi:hypothetical protein